MKMILTLFMLAVFAMFISVDNAETLISLEADTFLPQLEEETFSLAPCAVAREAEAEIVCIVTKWPHANCFSRAPLDAQRLIGIEISTAEGGSGGAGILPGGRSRLL